MENQATIEEIVKLEINYERGFYCEFRSSEGKPPGLYAGKKAPEGVQVIGVLDEEVPSRGAGVKGGLIE